MITLTSVKDPAELQKMIFANVRAEKAGAFDTWTIERRRNSEGVIHSACLVHTPNGAWADSAFYVKADRTTVEFYWFGKRKKEAYGYLHGRLLEQLAQHYGQHFDTAIYKDKSKYD